MLSLILLGLSHLHFTESRPFVTRGTPESRPNMAAGDFYNTHLCP